MKSDPVIACEETLVIPTYPVVEPDICPMFLEKRVNQGTNGRVYPHPLIDRLHNEKKDTAYRVIRLENEYLQILILPELGGRILGGLDKTNQYDFFYRQHVIKPALIGLFGPWISGGVEWCWPLHHRPSTFMFVDYVIENHDDGSATVWLSEHEPIWRMKGMIGLCLRPGRAVLEAKIRLYNRTPFVQSFLWWANVAVHVTSEYQVFLPPDVTYVTHHARAAMATFPIAHKYGNLIDYGEEGRDISWYKNMKDGMLSYFVLDSDYNFFGGYDHGKEAGLVHYSDHHVAPGKKMFSWGVTPFGRQWERNLTDGDGPYIELMAGAYSDNQPDFSWLQPYESKSFSQYWYPVKKIGPVKNANLEAAVNLEVGEGQVLIGVYATRVFPRTTVKLTAEGAVLWQGETDLDPEHPFLQRLALPAGIDGSRALLEVLAADGRRIISYAPPVRTAKPLPPAATVPPKSQDIVSTEELYLTGLHLEQYYQGIWTCEPYWQEALRREPGDARTNNALGLLHLRRGDLPIAEKHFRQAIATLTIRNPNPRDGEAYYNLGLTLKYMNRLDEAYKAFYKSIWSYAWQASGYYAMAEIDYHRGDLAAALDHLDRALAVNTQNLKARGLKTSVLRHMGRGQAADDLAKETIAMDPLDFWAQYESVLLAPADSPERRARLEKFTNLLRGETQTYLDIALDYADAALWEEAGGLLSHLVTQCNDKDRVHPMVCYALGYFHRRQGLDEQARGYYRQGAKASSDYCFPDRIEEMLILEDAKGFDPGDARAPYYLGNLLYDKKRYEEAIANWEASCLLDPGFAMAWRNLGIAYFNIRKHPRAAKACYDKAFAALPQNARLFYEIDQLARLMGDAPEERLARLEARLDLVAQRDDLYIERIKLCNLVGEVQKALDLILARQFHIWEGAWGIFANQYTASHLLLGQAALDAGRFTDAIAHFQAATSYPENLGEQWSEASEIEANYLIGLAYENLGEQGEARRYYQEAVKPYANLYLINPSMVYYQALALKKCGREEEGRKLLLELLEYAEKQLDNEIAFNYFSTALVNLLVFDDDPIKRNQVNCAYYRGLACLGLGKVDEARQAFEMVLSLDRNHLWAKEELKKLAKCTE